MGHDEVRYDAIVLGGGPAGSLTASILLRQCPGRRVLVLERERFPRHHVGEVTLPGWSSVLRRAGVLERLDERIPIKKVGVVFNWGPPEAGETWTADFREEALGRPAEGSWHVERGSFDAMLLAHAAELGAEVRHEARATDVRALPDHEGAPRDDASVEGMHVTWMERGEIRRAIADYVIDATGQARMLAHHWRLPLHRQADMNNYAVYGYWTGSSIHQTNVPVSGPERWAVVATCDVGWVWHIPIGLDVVSVGLVTSRETLRRTGRDDLCALYLDASHAAHPTLLARARWIGGLPDGTMPDRPQVVSDWSYHCERACGPGWFLVGDSALFVDPILSSGLTLTAQGALMAANALATLWNDPDVDARLLRESYQRRYRALGDLYLRMARVWYCRNTRASSWHWQAQRERLRAGGEALYERACDAFTAVCLGAVADPLSNAFRSTFADPLGNEFFSWLTAKRLFEGTPQGRWRDVQDADTARAEARRSAFARWGRIVRSGVRLRPVEVSVREGYHTSALLDRWKRVRYVEIVVPQPPTEPLRLAFADLDGKTERMLRQLDGNQQTADVLSGLLDGFAIGSVERARHAGVLVEMLVQLDMLDLLEFQFVTPRDALTGHPLLRVVVDAALRTVQGPATVRFELDWLGEQCLLEVDVGGKKRAFRLADARRAERFAFGLWSETTAATFLGRGDSWAERFLRKLLARIRAHEVGERAAEARSLWTRCAGLAATEFVARIDGERRVQLESMCG